MTALSTAGSVRLLALDADTRFVTAGSADGSPFSCLAERHGDGLVVLNDVRPYRGGPATARMLHAAADAVAEEFGVDQVAAVHPAVWDGDLVGVRPLHRIIHMGTVLDADLLAEVRRPPPTGVSVRPLTSATDDELAALSPRDARRADGRAWRQVRGGTLGPLVPSASVVLVAEDGEPVAAVGITEHQGAPLVGHLVAGRRGAGLGRTALVTALTALIDAGYGECRLNVDESNWIARRLYRSLGFTALRPPLRVSLIPIGGGHG
jgi:GNAT superfamily N-acetyltransferase